MKIDISRPYGSSTVLQITLSKTMKGIVVLKRLMVEWVVVKGFNEDLLTEDGKIDMWGESRYRVFQKVTEKANSAMLHFYSTTFPEIAIKSFFVSVRVIHPAYTLIWIIFSLFRPGSTATKRCSPVLARSVANTCTTYCHRHGEI